ncbi:uncharacterized protein LOC131649789 [Vicia villosa]|uniref:uncharacterized protein LOC131649789 n=1 Tax=Vicia villosa TaxID=3911 RepID=UPI00273BFA4F|nr:uncharacterized protein LOC131649789 [Vicia villosa]
MEATVFTSNVSVLVNGSPTKEFRVERGLRQGDPLSPFSIVIVAEALAGLVGKTIEIDEFSGFNVKKRCSVENLQFAADTLLVGEGTWKHVWSLKSILRGFEIVSGLDVNFQKSKLIGINPSPHFLLVATNFLSCRIKEKEFSFLGILIGSNPRRISAWSQLISKLKALLSSWTGRSLNLGGRITLLKHVLCSLSVFHSFFRALVAICKEIIRIQNTFLWRGTEDRRRIHWIRWNSICQPLERGGLGLKWIDEFNVALLTKWKWRILMGEDSLWVNILKARYGNLNISV